MNFPWLHSKKCSATIELVAKDVNFTIYKKQKINEIQILNQ